MAIFKSIEDGWTITREYNLEGDLVSEFRSRPLDRQVIAEMPVVIPPPTPTEILAALFSFLTDLPSSWK